MLKIIFQDPEDETIKLFDDHLTETVANCFSGPQTDEGIQVQVLKALLSIVTSGHIRVHQETLLLAVKTCYNIFLGKYNYFFINHKVLSMFLKKIISATISKHSFFLKS